MSEGHLLSKDVVFATHCESPGDTILKTFNNYKKYEVASKI